MNITFSTEALEPVPINSGWRGDYQPLDDGVTPVDLIQRFDHLRWKSASLWRSRTAGHAVRRRDRAIDSYSMQKDRLEAFSDGVLDSSHLLTTMTDSLRRSITTTPLLSRGAPLLKRITVAKP